MEYQIKFGSDLRKCSNFKNSFENVNGNQTEGLTTGQLKLYVHAPIEAILLSHICITADAQRCIEAIHMRRSDKFQNKVTDNVPSITKGDRCTIRNYLGRVVLQ